jgi:hypothetical protein
MDKQMQASERTDNHMDLSSQVILDPHIICIVTASDVAAAGHVVWPDEMSELCGRAEIVPSRRDICAELLSLSIGLALS